MDTLNETSGHTKFPKQLSGVPSSERMLYKGGVIVIGYASFFVSLVLAQPPDLGDSKISQSEILALRNRNDINSGEVELSLVRTDRLVDKPRRLKIHVWFDNRKIRMDEFEGTNRRVVCINDKEHIKWNPPAGAAAQSLTASGELPVRRELPTDPRMIGMCPGTFNRLSNYSPNRTVASPVRLSSQVRTEMIDGVECVVTEYVRRKGASVKLWIAEELNWSVVRVDFSTVEGYEETVRTKYEQDKSSGIWFPKEYSTKAMRSGVLKYEEKATVRVVSLNEPIDDTLFRLSGIELSAGTPVVLRNVDQTGLKRGYWDGEQITKSSPEVPQPKETSSRIWFVIGSIILIVSSIVVVVLRVRRS